MIWWLTDISDEVLRSFPSVNVMLAVVIVWIRTLCSLSKKHKKVIVIDILSDWKSCDWEKINIYLEECAWVCEDGFFVFICFCRSLFCLYKKHYYKFIEQFWLWRIENWCDISTLYRWFLLSTWGQFGNSVQVDARTLGGWSNTGWGTENIIT